MRQQTEGLCSQVLVEFGYPSCSDCVFPSISAAALRRMPKSIKAISSHPEMRSKTCCSPKLTTQPATTSKQHRGRPYNIIELQKIGLSRAKLDQRSFPSLLRKAQIQNVSSHNDIATTQPCISRKKRLLRSLEVSSSTVNMEKSHREIEYDSVTKADTAAIALQTR